MKVFHGVQIYNDKLASGARASIPEADMSALPVAPAIRRDSTTTAISSFFMLLEKCCKPDRTVGHSAAPGPAGVTVTLSLSPL